MTDEINKSFRYNGAMEGNRYKAQEAVPQKEQRFGMTRRGFLASVGNTAVVVGLGKTTYDHWLSDETENPTSTLSVEVPSKPVESVKSPEHFTGVVEGYKRFFMMENEVLIVDRVGHPVATVTIDVIDGISPGASYDPTLKQVTEGFSEAWREAAKRKVLQSRHDLTIEDLSMKTNWQALKQAVYDPDETMTYENTKSIIDIVRYFGNKETRGEAGVSRVEYVRNNVMFTGALAISPVMEEQLRHLLPGLCATESSFNDDVVSKRNARGIFQFMPDTWHKDLNRPAFVEGVSIPLIDQVDAAGELFSKMHERIRYWSHEEQNWQGRNYLEDVKTLFASQEDFERYFFTPCLLNAYNVGEKGIGEVIQAYAQSAVFHARQVGEKNTFDVFQEMTEFAQASTLPQLDDYGEEASSYVQKIYAFAELLDETAEEALLAAL